jgi:hypothetical protein
MDLSIHKKTHQILEIAFIDCIIHLSLEKIFKISQDPSFLKSNIYFVTPVVALVIYVIFFASRGKLIFKNKILLVVTILSLLILIFTL